MVTPQIGDIVEVETKQGTELGKLLESYEPGLILLKLNSGYNIGLKKEDVKDIRIIEKAKQIEEKKIEVDNKGKQVVDIIMAGGTIASKLDPSTGGVRDLGNSEELFKTYPEIFLTSAPNIVKLAAKATENMDSSDWYKIARAVVKSLKGSCTGIVVMIGTDFLHYFSAYLALGLGKINKPVVITYSQRSSDRGSSDARLNLECATKVALSDMAGVYVVGHASENDDFCYVLPATKCRKMHTSRRDTFKAINSSPIAKVWPDKIEVLRAYDKRGKEKVKENFDFENKIALIKFYPGQNPDLLEWYEKQGYRGLVIEASGLGHVIAEGGKSWLPALRKLIGRGIIICAAPQTIYGRLDHLVYSPGRLLKKTGVIFLEDMLPETAFVKLGLVLGRLGKNVKKEEAERLMLENWVGEFNDRLEEGFI